jgi:hypothetical protein
MRSPVAARTLNRHPHLSPPKMRSARPGIKCVAFRHRFLPHQRSTAMLTRRPKCFGEQETAFGIGKCVLLNRVCRRFGRKLRSKPYFCAAADKTRGLDFSTVRCPSRCPPVFQHSGSLGASIIWIGSLSSFCFAHATLCAHVNNTQQ